MSDTVDLSTIGSGLTREERETIIRTSAADDTWHIYTSDPAFARRLSKLCASWGVTPEKTGSWGMTLVLPRKAVTLRNLIAISDVERKRRAERLAESRTQRERNA